MSDTREKTVLITGAAGFIGSHLCDRFIAAGHTVIGMDNFLTGSQDNIAHLFGHPRFQFIHYNVTNYIYVAQQIDCVLHFACPASPIDYMHFPIQTLKVDSLGTLHTIGLAKGKKARYVFASTSEVYGDPEMHPQREEYWGNVNPVGPRSIYDEAKRFSEAMTMAYFRAHQVDVRIVRIFNTYGSRMRRNDGRVVPNFILQALRGEPITIYGDGRQTRSFCYIDDMVEGIFRIANSAGLNGEVINLGNPQEVAITDFALQIKELAHSSAELVYQPLPSDDPRRRCPDIAKAGRLLQWRPVVPLVEGLQRTIAYFRESLGITA
jgi:dTDP-glucose 4,6-dehydratase